MVDFVGLIVIVATLCIIARGIIIYSSDENSSRKEAARNTKNELESASILGAWWDILQVDRSASVQEIRAAYRRGLQQYHPDKFASLGTAFQQPAEQKTKELIEAYKAAMREKMDGLDGLNRS